MPQLIGGVAPVQFDSVGYYARCRPSAPACLDLETGRRWNYAQLDAEVARTASWLTGLFGPASGVRIATLGRNSAAQLILHLATVRAGAIYVPFNWRLAGPELAVLVEDAQPQLLVHDAEFDIKAFNGRRVQTGALEALVADAKAVPVRRPAHETSTLLYTSGTSGRPKGVMVSEHNAFWGCTNFNLGNAVTPHSAVLCDMPMFHTAGLFAAVRAVLLAGGTSLISRGFNAELTLARIADPQLGVTHYFSVPQMAQMLWQQPGFEPRMLQGLTVYATGGAPNPRAQIERFVDAGIPMSDGFGMSETGSSFGMPVHDPRLLRDKAGSCGLPYLSMQARIVDEDGRGVPPGAVGELWLRGPSITSGYWNQPELTAATFTEGWFKTGDAALCDADGYYFIVDRRKDMYISGGENVYPAEVEAALYELEAVAEAAVIGVPDDKWGEVGRAYVVLRQGRSMEAQAVLRHCVDRLAKYKVPASVVFTDGIPRTASGKVKKTELRERGV